jgi:hypothetical protein
MTPDAFKLWIQRVFLVGKPGGLSWEQAVLKTAAVLEIHRQTAYRKVAGTSRITKAEAARLAQYEKRRRARLKAKAAPLAQSEKDQQRGRA